MSESAGPPAGAPACVALNGWFWGDDTTGSGQYLTHLLRQSQTSEVSETSEVWRYILYVPAWSQTSEVWQTSEVSAVIPLKTPFDRLNRNLAKVWFEQIAFPRACQRIGADVAHVPYWGPPARIGLPLVTTVHDLIPLILPAYRGSPLVRLYTRLVSATLRRSDLVLTDSEASARDIRSRLGIAAQRVRVVYLAADERYQPVRDSARLAAVRERYGLPERFILYLGGFDQRKNVPALVRAYGRLRDRRADAPPLAIAGRLPAQDSPFFPDPRRVASAAGLETHVMFTGWVAEEDKPALYSLAACFVFPSLYEGFGLPVLEAMACGTPVVTSAGSSLGEVAGAGGLLVDPTSEAQIAEALERLVFDAGLRAQVAAAAQARAGQFTWAETRRQTRAAYRDVLRDSL